MVAESVPCSHCGINRKMWTLCRALLCGAAVEFGPQGCAGGQGPGSVGPEPMIRAEPQRLGIGIDYTFVSEACARLDSGAGSDAPPRC